MNKQKQIYAAMQSLDVIKRHTKRGKPMSEVEDLVDETYGLLNDALEIIPTKEISFKQRLMQGLINE